VSDSLALEFEVAAPPAHAFAVWTERLASWWPRTKTVSGGPEALAFEPYVGGRIVETGPDGVEHTWGEVLAWEPPHRLSFTWHLFFAPAEATEVSLTFTPTGTDPGAATLVRLTQTGFDRLGAVGEARRENTRVAWASLVRMYADAV
jgi:uncharacterized protein YndB with AHSA1/START domain